MITSRPVTAVVWDYDGTLVDTRAKNWNITRSLVHDFTGVDPDRIETLRSLDGYTRALHRNHNWRDLYVTEFGMSEEMTTEAGILWTERQLADATAAEVYDGIVDVLQGLATLPHGIVSMNSRANIERSLHNSGLLEYFDTVIGYEEVPADRQKPAPDGLLQCIETLTASKPGQVLYIGDHRIDIECARNATSVLRHRGQDIRVVAVGAAYGVGAEFGVWPDDPDYALQAPVDLLGLLAGCGGAGA